MLLYLDIGDIMYEKKFIEFLQELNLYSEEVLDFMKDKTVYVDYNDEDSKEFIGCYPIMKNNMIKDIRLCVPVMEDDFTTAINVHEYIHLIRLYKYLNKHYVFTNSEEVNPVIFEILFLSTKGDNEFGDYLDYYREYVKSKKDPGLDAFLELYDDIDLIKTKKKTINK